MHNCNFNKTHLLAKLRGMAWRLEQYRKDARVAKHNDCEKFYTELERDLLKHGKKLEQFIVKLAKEGKYGFCEKC
ncbi:hypothetical protein HY639_05310 [Candidatus Woesearchaeota archaeon]|nr:hypothetical protein [Candidatus Woesearchaeota archaeon]